MAFFKLMINHQTQLLAFRCQHRQWKNKIFHRIINLQSDLTSRRHFFKMFFFAEVWLYLNVLVGFSVAVVMFLLLMVAAVCRIQKRCVFVHMARRTGHFKKIMFVHLVRQVKSVTCPCKSKNCATDVVHFCSILFSQST